MRKAALAVVALAALVAGCADRADTQPDGESTSTVATLPTNAARPAATSPSTAVNPDTTVVSTTTDLSTAAARPSADEITIPSELRVTPDQAEGPYYPVSKPDDRDNNLLVLGSGDPTTVGTPLEISGLLLYDDGTAVEGAVIEIWQVDGQGIYDHPRAPGTDSRDPAFQFYGESVTDAQGFWTFLTLDPVLYESRPRHIHVKVKVDDAEILTTQIYFDGDPLLNEDGLAAAAGDDLVMLTTRAVPATLSTGQAGLVARHIIVLTS